MNVDDEEEDDYFVSEMQLDNISENILNCCAQDTADKDIYLLQAMLSYGLQRCLYVHPDPQCLRGDAVGYLRALQKGNRLPLLADFGDMLIS